MKKILIVSTEVAPFAKSGGLGDVIGSLPKELVKKGIDARVVLPKYRTIKKDLLKDLAYIGKCVIRLNWREHNVHIHMLEQEGVKIYFLENDYFFGRDGFYGYGDDNERFAFFSDASIAFLNFINFKPDVIHSNDWQTALVPVYLKDNYYKYPFYNGIKTVFTIHNLKYQGIFSRHILENINLNSGYFTTDKFEFYGNASYMKAGLMYADKITTVSQTYAKEIQTHDFGYGLDGVLRYRSNDLIGILNGVDTDVYNPATDKSIFANYDADNIQNKRVNKINLQKQLGLPEKDVPIFALISRLVDQKGLDLIQILISKFLTKDIQFIVLGTGEKRYEDMFKHFAYWNSDKLSANIFFGEELAQKIYAGSDMFLMPSLFEPCGLSQIFSMIYGTIPIVRNTGGLCDTVSHIDEYNKTGTGIVFNDYDANGLLWGINEAIRYYNNKELWNQIIINAMKSDFSWKSSADKYIDLYNALTY